MTTIMLELESCVQIVKGGVIGKGCPFCTQRHTPGSGFATDYMCERKNNQITSGYVEWTTDINPVPDWCPLRADKDQIAKNKQEKLVAEISGAGI